MFNQTDELLIKTQTSGFASPAETYVDKRLDINDLVVRDVYTTFYFRYSGPNVFGVKQNDVVVVDRSDEPKDGDLVILTDKNYFKLREYKGQENLWGKVSWVISKR
jgi:DNA polymerase V